MGAKTGYGILIQKDGQMIKEISESLPNGTTIYQAELKALNHAITEFIKLKQKKPVMIYTDSLMMAFAMNLAHHLFSAAWPGIPPSTAADLVMPRMRAVAGAYYILVNTFIGLALGPYFMGQLSDSFKAGGMGEAEALQTAIASAMGIFALTLIFLTLAWRYLPKDEANRLERAKALGENVQEATGGAAHG